MPFDVESNSPQYWKFTAIRGLMAVGFYLPPLKIELRKCGQRVTGNKTELLGWLIEAIQNNAPVLEVAEVEKRPEFMNGLEVTA